MGRKYNGNSKIFSSIFIVIVICGGFLPLIGHYSSQFFPIPAYKDNYEENNKWNQEALLEKDDSIYLASYAGELDDPISINSNDDLYDLKLQGVITGDGTEGNPYILENLVIDTDFSGPAIDIGDTDAYLIINNCNILNSGTPDGYSGVIIRNCSNIKIMNCLVENTYEIILYDNSFNNTVINNTILHTNGFSAISISGAHHNKILNNTLMYTENYAINLWEAENNVISGNIMTNNHGGIQVEHSHSNDFFENEILGKNEKSGFKLRISNENTISRNSITKNRHGINLISSNDNIICFNDINENLYTQAREDIDCTGNQWDNGTIGNYWGNDYINKYPDATNDGTVWDTPYEIDGEGLGIDHFPLVNLLILDIKAPIFTYVPLDFSADEGYSDLSISWTAADLYPSTYTIELDGTEVVSAIAWTTGIAISYDIPDELLEGNHSITIIISDENGNTAQDTVIFTVIDVLTYESPIGSYPWLWLSILCITSIAIVTGKNIGFMFFCGS